MTYPKYLNLYGELVRMNDRFETFHIWSEELERKNAGVWEPESISVYDFLDRDKSKYVCPGCGKEFKTTHPATAGQHTSRKWINPNDGLAKSNFQRHLLACNK